MNVGKVWHVCYVSVKMLCMGPHINDVNPQTCADKYIQSVSGNTMQGYIYIAKTIQGVGHKRIKNAWKFWNKSVLQWHRGY